MSPRAKSGTNEFLLSVIAPSREGGANAGGDSLPEGTSIPTWKEELVERVRRRTAAARAAAARGGASPRGGGGTAGVLLRPPSAAPPSAAGGAVRRGEVAGADPSQSAASFGTAEDALWGGGATPARSAPDTPRGAAAGGLHGGSSRHSASGVLSASGFSILP